MVERKLTENILKEKSEEFDIETIFDLTIPNLGLFDLGCIGKCTSLITLDLSNNNITSVMALRTLNKLQILDISNNRLSALSGLEHLESLYTLNASGNLLNSIDCLLPLTKLNTLHTLFLHEDNKRKSNPLYDHGRESEEIDQEIKILLPPLACLNGTSFSEDGIKFHLLMQDTSEKGSRKFDFGKYKRPSFQHIEELPFVRVGFENNECYEMIKDISDQCVKSGDEMKNLLKKMRAEYLA